MANRSLLVGQASQSQNHTHGPQQSFIALQRSTNQSIADNSLTSAEDITFTSGRKSADADEWSSWDGTTGLDLEPGAYLVTVWVQWASSATGQRFAQSRGTSFGHPAIGPIQSHTGLTKMYLGTSASVPLSAAETMTMRVWQNSGGALNAELSLLTVVRLGEYTGF